MHLFILKVIGGTVSNKSLSFVGLWLLHVDSWRCKIWERGSLLLNMLCVLVSCGVHRGFAVLGPNFMLKLDGLKSIPPWHTFQVGTDWMPSGFWMWPSLEAVYEISSQSTAGLCLPLCYILVMPSNSIWKNTKTCKPKLKSDWLKLAPNSLSFLPFFQSPSWKLLPERIPCVNFIVYYLICGRKYIIFQTTLEKC